METHTLDTTDSRDSNVSDKDFEAIFVRTPQTDVPFTYKIGWWLHQDREHLRILDLKCEVIDPRLHVFNTKFLLRITISGWMKTPPERRPHIKAVHITEKIIRREPADNLAEVEMMPIVETEPCQEYTGDWVPFTICQELVLSTMDWTTNTFAIKCGNIQQNIEVFQNK